MTTSESSKKIASSLAFHDGEAKESKIFSTIGKCLCIYLILRYAQALINHWEVLLVLFSWLIAPDIAKKAITMKFNSSQPKEYNYGYQEKDSQTSEKSSNSARKSSSRKQEPIKDLSGE